jgi:FHA domain
MEDAGQEQVEEELPCRQPLEDTPLTHLLRVLLHQLLLAGGSSSQPTYAKAPPGELCLKLPEHLESVDVRHAERIAYVRYRLCGGRQDCEGGPTRETHSPSVSRWHAMIRVAEGTAMLEDLGSRNGTFVGNRRTTGVTALNDRDATRLGSVVLTLRAVPAPASTQAQLRATTASSKSLSSASLIPKFGCVVTRVRSHRAPWAATRGRPISDRDHRKSWRSMRSAS